VRGGYPHAALHHELFRAEALKETEVIELRALHKRFGRTVAVDDVSFTGADGCITGLLGPNGAGKTTSLRMLSGLLHPDRGTVLVDGKDALKDPVGARGALGVLPESRGLYTRLTARENLRYYGRLQGVNGARLDKVVNHLIGMLELTAVADRATRGFSQGERMKVTLARALVHDPRNVVLDEPTNGLDIMSLRGVRALLRRLRDEGKCVLLSSHFMQEVSALCDRIVVIAAGRVVAEGTPQDLRRAAGQEDLEDAFVCLVGAAGRA
jgi:sodium transport system ATP-binding protein